MEASAELMTSPEVSRLLQVSVRTVHRRAEAGDLPPAQKLPGPNGAYLFHRADVERLVAAEAARSREVEHDGARTQSAAGAR